MAFLLGSIDKLCHERKELSPEDITEVQNTAEVLMCRALAIDGGRAMSSAQLGMRHLWLGLSSLADRDQKGVLGLPQSAASLFGHDIQAIIDRLEAAARGSQKLTPHLHPRRGRHA